MPTPPRMLRIALELLSKEYDRLSQQHSKTTPKNGIPVGGGDWMDSFFRMEGVRGVLSALGRKVSLKNAIQEGKAVSEVSVEIWNKRREWQVHRWTKTVHNYLDSLYRRIHSAYCQER